MRKCPCRTCGAIGLIQIGDVLMPCPDCNGHGYTDKEDD